MFVICVDLGRNRQILFEIPNKKKPGIGVFGWAVPQMDNLPLAPHSKLICFLLNCVPTNETEKHCEKNAVTNKPRIWGFWLGCSRNVHSAISPTFWADHIMI